MDCLWNNLKYIKKKNIYLYGVLRDYNLNNDENIARKFEIIEARDGKKIVQILNDDRIIRLNSLYSPEKEAKEWAYKYKDIRKITSVILYGYGDGIFFSKIKNKIKDTTYIFWYEPDIELFNFCLQHFDMTQILSYNNLFLYIEGINSDDLFMDLCGNTNWTMIPSQIVCYHTGYKKLNKEKYEHFNLLMNEYRYAIQISKNTALKYSKKFSINILKNIHFIKSSNYIGELVGKVPENIPVIIVSAGPSLQKNVCELKKAWNRALILATDTAVNYLQCNNVKFDAIVTIDGDKHMEKIGDECCKELPMFTMPDAKNKFLEENNGRKIWITGSGYLDVLYQKYGFIFPKYVAGGSVATAAFQIAKMLRSKIIILVGQDLAYSGKITHAGNAIDKYKNDAEEIYIEGVLKDRVRTRYDWLRYLQWFENAIAQFHNGEIVVNATEGGARIHGAIEMTLSKAIAEYCNKYFDFNYFLSKLDVTFKNDNYFSICNDIVAIPNEIDEILNAANCGIESVQKIIEMIKEQKIEYVELKKYLNMIDIVKEKIKSKKIYFLLDEYISEDIVEILEKNNRIYNNEIEELLESVNNDKTLFGALINAANELKLIVRQSVDKMYNRLK